MKSVGRASFSVAASLFSSYLLILSISLAILLSGSAPPANAQGQPNRSGAFVYTGNNGLSGTTNQLINGYVINATSGVLSQAAGTPFAAGGQVLSIAAHPSGKFAYVATANGTVAAYTVDSYAGMLTPVPGSPFASGAGAPRALVIDPLGKYLYEAAGNNLYAFSIDSNSGALSAVSGSPYSTVGALAVAVDPSDKYLVVSNGSGASVYAITGDTGALTAVSSMLGCGGTSMAFEPSGHFLYGAYAGITACSFSSTSGGLAPVSGSPFGSGLSISGVAVHPSGSFLYASDLNCTDSGPSNWLYGYVIDPSTGALTAIGGSPFALPSETGCYYDEGVATEASGNFVYTVDANYGTAAYKVNQTTGVLTLASSSFSSPGAYTLATVPNSISSTATLTGLTIIPSEGAQIATSTLGKQYQFTLQGTFSDGSTGFLTGSATWTSSQTSVATVSAGLATSTGYGSTTITATLSGISATAILNVTMPALTSITITPSSVTVYQGAALQLKATGRYADGSSADVTSTVTWGSSDDTIATVSAQGLVQTIALGSITVSATNGVSGTASVKVIAPVVTISSRGAFVYTGNNGLSGTTNQLTNGYVINATSGVLNAASGTPFAAGGQVLSIAAHPSGKFVYVATANGAVAAFTVDSYTGTLTPVPGSPYSILGSSGGFYPVGTFVAIDPAGRYLYVAGQSGLFAFSIDSGSGALTAVAGSPYSTGGALAVAVDPSDKYLVVSNGSGAWVYAITSGTGALTAVSSTLGCGGTSMTFEPSGHFLYGSQGWGIMACSFNSTSGVLVPVSGSPFDSGLIISGIAVHPSGAFLYASEKNCVNNGPSNWLHGYVIDPSTGALTAIGGSPFALPGGSGCYYDYDVSTEPSGNFVYTVDANYGTAAYKVNQSTGALTLVYGSFSSPGAETLATVPNAISSAATLTSLQIVPNSAQIATSTLGKRYQFTLKGTFSDGSTGFLTGSATWSSSDATVATVSAGLATSIGYGTAAITATVNEISATALLTVTTPPLGSVSITPSSVTVYQSTALQLKATGQYADGSSVDVTSTATWSSSDATIATVSAQGLVQTIKPGTVTITVLDGDATGTATVNVISPVVTIAGRGAFVYTGGNGYSGSSTPVSGYAISATNGTLSAASGSPFALPGRLLKIAGHPSGKFVYVVTANSQVSAFTVDSLAGTLTPVAGSPYTISGDSGGYYPAGTIATIDPAGKYLYVASSSGVYGFAIDSGSGALSALAGSPFSISGVSAVTVDPSGQYLVAWTESGSLVYSIASGTGVLTAVSSTVSGCGGGSMTFEPSGHFLYGNGFGGISACSFNSTSGTLAPVSGSPFGSGLSINGLAAHPSGAFLYASDLNCVDNSPSNWLYGYVIDPSTGALTAIGGSPFALPGGTGCYYDEDVAAESSGNFVYTVDANYGTAAYKVNALTGALTLASSSFYSPAALTLATVPNAISSTATLTSLQIVPNTAQIATSTLGKQYQFTLKGTFSDGSTGFLTGSATWTSSDATVATVAAGLATSTGYGSTTIIATLSGISATATLNVTTPVLTSITIAPSSVTVYQGTALQLKATGQYADGSSVDITNTATWSSSDNTIATISPQGLVQTIALGTITVSAKLQTITGSGSVTAVTPFAWKTPAPITYGTPLGSTQLNATSGASGTYVYNPPAGTILSAGTQSLNVAFTPDSSYSASLPAVRSAIQTTSRRLTQDSPNTGTSSTYLGATATVSLVVNAAAPTVSLSCPEVTYDGKPHSCSGSARGLGGANVSGSWNLNPASATTVGSYLASGAFTSSDSNYTNGTANATLKIDVATPVITWSTPASVSYGNVLSAAQLNATASVPGTFVYSPAAGAILPVGNDTLTVTFTPNDLVDYAPATATVTLVVTTPVNPLPVVGTLSPAYVSQGETAFTLAVTGVGFTANSTVYWGTTALATQYISATQVKAQVPAANIATAGLTAVTVQTPSPGGGTSNSLQFEVDSASSGTTPPSFTTLTATVAAGATATYPVTLPSAAANVTVMCVNLPAGATCSYSSSTHTVTIATAAATPAATYQITVVFTETLPGVSTALILLPIALLPLLFVRRRLASRGMWITVFLGLIFAGGVIAATGCGGGSSASPVPPNSTHQVTSSGTVSLTVQ